MNGRHARSCDSSARTWCLRVFTLSIVFVTFVAMLFYSWGGVIFDDDPYIAAYVNACMNISFGMDQISDNVWCPIFKSLTWIATPPDASYVWDGECVRVEGCVSLLGVGNTI